MTVNDPGPDWRRNRQPGPASAASRARAHARRRETRARIMRGKGSLLPATGVRNQGRKGRCNALRATPGPAQTAGAETGPMTHHDIP